MSDRQPEIETAAKARQGETTGVVRWVLGISLSSPSSQWWSPSFVVF